MIKAIDFFFIVFDVFETIQYFLYNLNHIMHKERWLILSSGFVFLQALAYRQEYGP